MSRLVPDWLLEHAAARPDAPAVVDSATRWTYADLARVSLRIARRLRAAGVGEGTPVAMLVADSAPAVALVHGVRLAGGVLVALNRRAAVPELGVQLAHAAAPVIVHDADRTADAGALAEDTAGQLFGIERLLAGSGEASAAADLSGATKRREVDLASPATILFTSGTTGRPKGAVLTHGCHSASADAWAAFLDPRPTDRWLACLPLYHVAGLAIVDRAARWGLPVEIHDRFDPVAVNRAIDAGVSHLSLVAATLERLLDVRGERPVPPTLRAILVGGGPIPPDLVRRAIEWHLPVCPTYGLTETASGVAALGPADAPRRPASAGRSLAGVELSVEVDGRPANAGEVGEIFVRGAMVFEGYLGRSTDTERTVHRGRLRTGDLGALDADGFLTVVDRRDDLIVSGGENVYPAEVEAVLAAHPAVVDAAVVGRPDARWGAVPAAAVVLRPGAAIDDEALAAHCRQRLAGYKVPVEFRRLAAIPRTSGGKPFRREVRSILGEPAR